jgi:hypothetical protein
MTDIGSLCTLFLRGARQVVSYDVNMTFYVILTIVEFD